MGRPAGRDCHNADVPPDKESPTPPLTPRGRPAPASFHVLTKPTGAICNLDCDYCFFLAKEELYPGSTFRMTEPVLEAYISQLLAAHRTPEVTIAWQGGEPTHDGPGLLPARARDRGAASAPGAGHRAHDPDERHPDRRHVGARSSPSTTSSSGVSIDGPARAARRLPAGQGRQADVRPCGPRAAHPAGARGAVERPDHDQLRERGAPAGGVPVPARRAGRGVHPVHPHRRAALTRRDPDRRPGDRAIREPRWVRDLPGRGVRRVGPPRRRAGVRADVRHHAGQLPRRAGRHVRARPHLRHRPRPGAQRRPVLVRPLRRARAPAGQHHRAPDARADQLAAAGRLRSRPSTTTCPATAAPARVRFACHGGCPKDRFTTTPDGEPGLHYLCPSYKAFFAHVDKPMRFMAGALRSGRLAEDVIPWMARMDKRATAPG